MTATLELEPFLIIDGNNFTYTISTGNAKVDSLIKTRIARDHTGVSGIIWGNYQVVRHYYDRKTNTIKLTIKKKKGKWNVGDIKIINGEQVDPHNVGPDTWMEGNIGILSEKEAKGLGAGYGDGAELGVIGRRATLPDGKVVNISEVGGGASYKYITVGGSKSSKKTTGSGPKTLKKTTKSGPKTLKKTTKTTTKTTTLRKGTPGRKAPAEKASTYSVGTKKKGIDGTMWSVVKIKGGILRWSRLRS